MGRFNKKVIDYDMVEEQLNRDIFLVSEKIVNSFNKKTLLVLDTSVVVKWFFKDDENNTAKAEIILNQYLDDIIKIVIPELSAFELANVLKDRVKKHQEDQLDIVDRLYKMGIIFYIDKEILKSAIKLAIDINESVYDCIFLATAEHFGGRFITDDSTLFTNYNNYKKKKIEISMLEDYKCKSISNNQSSNNQSSND